MKKRKQVIVVKTDFPALHFYKDFNGKNTYLKHPHRHRFFIRLEKEVSSTKDREIEFIEFKEKIESYIQCYYWGQDLGAMSCEKIAHDLLKKFKASSVEVLEDNENGIVLGYV